MTLIKIERKILEKNDAIAAELRTEFREKNLYVLNLLGSPGSGKTSIIEKSIQFGKEFFAPAVIVGDVQTDNDAVRINKYGIPVAQIITNGACHLEANLVREAYHSLPEKKDFNLLIVENVGNLVCPAGFDLGEHIKTVVVSVTEGEDKPLKYPAMFRNSSLLLINKTDLLPYLNFSVAELKKNALKVNQELEIFELSCYTGEGFSKFCSWLGDRVKEHASPH